jgi:hypothetical protein
MATKRHPQRSSHQTKTSPDQGLDDFSGLPAVDPMAIALAFLEEREATLQVLAWQQNASC